MKNVFKKLLGARSHYENYGAYLVPLSKPHWSHKSYNQFASEAYIKNVIAHRSIALIASAASSVTFRLFTNRQVRIEGHPILNLLAKPNPLQSGRELLESLYSYKLIAGSSYLLAVGPEKKEPTELYALRPDRVSVIPGNNFIPEGFEYRVGERNTIYKVDQLTGKSRILQIKSFNPLSDWEGLSSIEAAAYSIDQHNQAGEWNQSLLQNGARPSGAIVVKNQDGSAGSLNDQQFSRIKQMIDDIFSGPKNAGRPILLEGGLDWKEMSLTPKDMDFIASKHSSARDIALALGAPPQLLGIPGDNTYSNLQEARLAFWEQTIIPLVENVAENLSNWLSSQFNTKLELRANFDEISALSERRDAIWKRMEECSFLTINEKRKMVGLNPLKDTDSLQ